MLIYFQIIATIQKQHPIDFYPPFPSLYLKIYMVETRIEGWFLICDKIYCESISQVCLSPIAFRFGKEIRKT